VRRVLIAGCGYVGGAAARLFRNEGWQVTAWSRSAQIEDDELTRSIRVASVDLTSTNDVQRHSFACDVVVHCASTRGGGADEYRRLYRDGVGNLLTTFPSARIIFTSSTSVYAQRDGSWVDENSPAEPPNAKGRILREAEELVLAAKGVVLRLGGIYGPQRSAMLRATVSGRISGGADRWVNQVHRDDAASAILFAATRKPDVTGVFNVVDNTPALRSEIVTWLAAELGRTVPEPAESTSPARGYSNKRVSNAKLRQLGWMPRFASYKEGFRNSVFVDAKKRT
jgi:nucleoside-diphosphate-sugar epimerase